MLTDDPSLSDFNPILSLLVALTFSYLITPLPSLGKKKRSINKPFLEIAKNICLVLSTR